MFEHIISPDGKYVWCEDYDAPDDMKSRWIPIADWEKEFENKIKCPQCSGFLEIITFEWEGKEEEAIEDQCSECEEWFDLVSRKPLTIRHNGGDIYRCKVPIELVNEKYNVKGEITLQVGGDEEDMGYDHDELLDLFNEAVHDLPNELIRNLNDNGGFVFEWDEAEWIRKNETLYVLNDGSYKIEDEEE
jgi:hypothetical protein